MSENHKSVLLDVQILGGQAFIQPVTVLIHNGRESNGHIAQRNRCIALDDGVFGLALKETEQEKQMTAMYIRI